jgi:sirohydrochlorin cobaltochelatase
VKSGLLLFAHGSRDPRWAEPFEAVVARVRERAPALAVALAYLELMAPSIEDAAALLVAGACTRIDVVPLFLGAGGHVRGDLPELLQKLQRTHADVTWRLLPAIGAAPEVVAAMADAALRLTLGEPPAA